LEKFNWNDINDEILGTNITSSGTMMGVPEKSKIAAPKKNSLVINANSSN
jgi:hypothetical protein